MSADQQPASPPSPRVVAGRYRLGARRGTSVDAARFDAVDEQLHRAVVVTLVHPDISARPDVQAEFRAAMQVAGGLHHPNIAVAHEWGVTDWSGRKVLYVVSEQLTGGSLRDLLDRGRLLSPSQALLVGLDACKALDVLHKRGVLHGDIRPSTLVFGDDRRLRLVDAGLSQVLAAASGGPVHRSIDVAKYTSPEQARGGPLEAKSDVYSLCLTLFESLTGTVPFVGDSTVATLANRIDKLLPVSADLGALASVLERAGRPEPGDRFAAAEFGRALVQAAERLPRPEPLPIVANSLFAPDRGSPNEPVDPTGPLSRATMPLRIVPGEMEQPAGTAAPSLAPPLSVVRTADLPVTQPLAPAPPAPTAPTAAPATTVTQPIGSMAADTAVMASISSLARGAGSGIADPDDLADAADDLDDDLDGGADDFPERPPHQGKVKKWFLLVLLLMAAAGGVLAWYSAKPEQRTVPDLEGMSQGVALNAIAGDFKGVISEEASETVDMGVIIRTEPKAGTVVDKDSTVTLFVSTGPAPRELPELTGLTVAAASSTLEQLGLVVEVADPEYDETVPKDVVLSWTVPDSPTLKAGGTVTKGTAVRIVASAGPAPRIVPDLAGMNLTAVTAALTDVQLTVTKRADEYSDTVPAGTLVRQDPAPGASVPRDSTVTVVFSKGHAPIKIPAFTTVVPDEIRALLEKAGFVFGGVEGDPTKAFIGLRVDGQPAVTGTEYPYGTKVTIVYATA